MIHMPAFCDSCSNVFPSGIVVADGGSLNLKGNTSRCPKCGFYARIPDGVFNFYNNAIEILEATETTVKDFQKLYAIINKVNTVGATTQSVQEEIEKEVPKLSFLAKYLPQNAKELAAYLSVIAALIASTNVNISPHIEYKPKTEINNHYNVEQVIYQTPPTDEVENIDLFTGKIGRNQPCPCESGLKYKRCHGK